jgi:hypothetical protein
MWTLDDDARSALRVALLLDAEALSSLLGES